MKFFMNNIEVLLIVGLMVGTVIFLGLQIACLLRNIFYSLLIPLEMWLFQGNLLLGEV